MQLELRRPKARRLPDSPRLAGDQCIRPAEPKGPRPTLHLTVAIKPRAEAAALRWPA
jgi:hypothetical protein